MADKYEVVYNSDVIINDHRELATLAIFYDRVFMPYADLTAPKLRLSDIEGALLSNLADEESALENYAETIRQWHKTNDVLFKENILSQLPPPISYVPAVAQTLKRFDQRAEGRNRKGTIDNPAWPWENDLWWVSQHKDISIKEVVKRSNRLTLRPSYLPQVRRHIPIENEDLLLHLLRDDIDLPQLFTMAGPIPSRELLVGLEIRETFKYLLPKVSQLEPAQIVEVRNKVKDTREGFSMHMLRLSKGLEEHARQGAPVEAIANYARSLIETEIIPYYREFRRQIDSERAGWWKNVLNGLSSIAEVEAPVWSPKVLALILKALGMTFLETASEQKARLSNRYQAFQFMSEIENLASAGMRK
jgi:hypothetical protein